MSAAENDMRAALAGVTPNVTRPCGESLPSGGLPAETPVPVATLSLAERCAELGLTMPELRPHQEAAMFGIRSAIKGGQRRPVLMAVCSFGKTVCAAAIAVRSVVLGNRVMMVVDNLELVGQTIETFERYGLTVGVMQAMHPQYNPAAMVQIATAQTLVSRIPKKRAWWETYPVATILIDECHVRYKALDELHGLYPDAVYVGLTATPWRKGMAADWDTVVHTISVPEMLEAGWLTPITVYSHPCPSWAKVRTTAGEYVMSDAAREYTPSLMGNVVRTWETTTPGMSTIAFACDKAHGKAVAEEFQAAGHSFVAIDGDTDPDERREMIDRFKAGKITGISTCQIAIKGFDATIAQVMIDVQPTKSLSRHHQKLGRIARLHPGKDRSIVLDFAGNAIRNGLPTDDVPVELDDGSKDKPRKDKVDGEKPLPAKCKSCNALRPSGGGACPACGFMPETQARPLDHEPGELEILTGEPARRPKAKEVTTQEKRDWFSSSIRYAKDMGYKPGWAYYAFEARFGHKPQGYAKNAAPRCAPEVSQWCASYSRKKARAYAKSKKAEQRGAFA